MTQNLLYFVTSSSPSLGLKSTSTSQTDTTFLYEVHNFSIDIFIVGLYEVYYFEVSNSIFFLISGKMIYHKMNERGACFHFGEVRSTCQANRGGEIARE